MKKFLLNVLTNNIIPFVGKLRLCDNRFCNIIYYHDIVRDEGYSYMRMPVQQFKEQMLWIAENGYETLRFDDFQDEEKLKFKKKRVLIAFDDGWLSNYTEIFDFMKEHNIKYNVYLTMGEIGKNPDYLTWDMVKEMHRSGLVGFGAHTYTHPSMKDLSLVDCDLEITKANELFYDNLGFYPLDFCYPFGYYSEDSNKYMVNNTDYARIYTSDMSMSYKLGHKIIFSRNGISKDYNFSLFQKVVKGYNNTYKDIFPVLLRLKKIISR